MLDLLILNGNICLRFVFVGLFQNILVNLSLQRCHP